MADETAQTGQGHAGTLGRLGGEVSLEFLNRAAARLAFLSEAGHILNLSLDLDSTFQSLARLVIPTIADWCTISVLKPDRSIERIAVAHADPEKERPLHAIEKRFPPDYSSPTGPAYVIRTGRDELMSNFQNPEQMNKVLDEYCRNPEFNRLVREVGLSSYMTIPMVPEGGRAIGAIWFARSRPQRDQQFTDEDMALAHDVTAIAAKAVRNATLYQEAVDATEKLKIQQQTREEYIRRQIHDIKTPLSAAALVIDLLERKARGQEKVEDLAKSAHENIKRASRMLDNLRSAESEIDRGKAA